MFAKTAATARTVLTLVMAYVLAGVDSVQRFTAEVQEEALRMQSGTRAQGGSVTTLVSVGATLLIGVLVLSQIVEALPDNNGAFSGAVTQIETILNSSFLLAAILPLVIIAGAVLFYVRGFNGGGGGGGRMQ
jgi:hypothetical protein